jgi:hypothetical protein
MVDDHVRDSPAIGSLLQLPPGLFDLLVQRQLRRGYRDAITDRLGVVWLHTDLGSSYYLAADGRVLGDDLGVPLHDIVPPELYTVLVAASKTIVAPERLDLLPSGPADARDCNLTVAPGWGVKCRSDSRE